MNIIDVYCIQTIGDEESMIKCILYPGNMNGYCKCILYPGMISIVYIVSRQLR